MVTLLLILAASSLTVPQARHPVRWTRAVGPSSRQALEAGLKRPVKLPRGQEIYEHSDRHRQTPTCADYARAMKNGWRNNANTFEMTMAASFKEECDVPLLILAAKPSRVSYVQNFKLDESAIDLLPPTLSWILSGDEAQAAEEAERKGLSWKKFKPGLKTREKYRNGMTFEEPDEATIELEIKAFGDFNGDEIEDVLLFKSTHAINGTFSFYQPVILTRTADGGPLKAFSVEDADLQKAATKVRQTGSNKPANSLQLKRKPR
jgi:hypothetical protein